MSITTRDVFVWIVALIAFPLAVAVTAALSTDGIPDRTVPIVHR